MQRMPSIPAFRALTNPCITSRSMRDLRSRSMRTSATRPMVREPPYSSISHKKSECLAKPMCIGPIWVVARPSDPSLPHVLAFRPSIAAFPCGRCTVRGKVPGFAISGPSSDCFRAFSKSRCRFRRSQTRPTSDGKTGFGNRILPAMSLAFAGGLAGAGTIDHL